MKKNQMEIVVKLNVSAEKRRALEMYGLRGHNAKGFAGSGGTDFNAKI